MNWGCHCKTTLRLSVLPISRIKWFKREMKCDNWTQAIIVRPVSIEHFKL